ncbi:ankyrin repeat domain-containing protein [Pirellulaceae bacterium SH501]|jgi:ankyrin repeat protein
MKPDEIKLRNLMIECSESGNTQQFIELYKSNPEIHSAGSWLYNAAEDGQPELIRYLISVGRDPNERSRYSLMTSALSAASRNGSIQSVELLLRAGASLGVDSIDDNPLFSAIYGRNLDCAKLLVKAGIDFHKTYDLDHRFKNALAYADEMGCKDIAAYLREHGAVLPPQK